MTALKYDYRALEDQFVRGKMSVRELCRINNIPQERVSSIHDQARKVDAKGRTWYDKRAEYQSRSTDKTIELLSAREARRALREAEVQDNAIDAIDEAVSKMRADMRATRRVKTGETDDGKPIYTEEPIMRVTPKDLGGLLDRLMPLLGRPTLITEEHHLGVTVSANPESSLGVATLARLASQARSRSRQPEPRRVGPDPQGVTEGDRAN